MKTIFTKYLAFSSLALVMLASCKKDETKVTSNGGKPGALTATITSLVLDKTKLGDPTKVINFTFSASDFGYTGAVVTNTLQIDVPSDNWKNPTSVVITSKDRSQGYTTTDFNNMLLKLNLAGGVAATVEARIQHSLGPGTTPVYSNVLSLTVTPFYLTAYLYTVGAYNGWDIGHTDSLRSETGNGIYSGVINFTAGNNQFLIVPGRHSYDNKYATEDPQNTTSTTVKANAANNLYAPAAAGNYLVTINTNNSTISFTAVNYYSITGPAVPAGDWGLDTDLKYVNDGSDTWTGTFPFTVNEFKVRQNHDWTWSWGVLKTPDGVTLANANDDNLKITAAGSYKFTFTIPLTTTDVKTPQVNATYTLVKQ